MADRATTARAEAAEGFAAVLCELRDSVGTPSFRVMAGRSRVISHTTLHEAVKGNRLPSWGTTAEFVKACGADPMAYRERWEAANRAWNSARPPDVGAPASEDARPLEGAGRSAGVPVPPVPGAPGRRRRYVIVGGAAVGVLAAVGVVWSLAARDEPPPVRPPELVASDCPVRQPNPPAAPPAHQGDRAQFIADITIPDCDHAHRGETVTKIWRFKNAGTRPWVGYTLHRLDLPQGRDQCQTISDLTIPDTRPGGLVDVKTEVSVPNRSGFCFVRFKMMDEDGKVAFPGGRPVNFQLIVD